MCDIPNNIQFGITPADAGKTTVKVTVDDIDWDHPRGCGENADTPTVPPKVGGSPPRMRGKQVKPRRIAHKAGITPADAGKTYRFLYCEQMI